MEPWRAVDNAGVEAQNISVEGPSVEKRSKIRTDFHGSVPKRHGSAALPQLFPEIFIATQNQILTTFHKMTAKGCKEQLDQNALYKQLQSNFRSFENDRQNDEAIFQYLTTAWDKFK
jgi:hypothetical protein